MLYESYRHFCGYVDHSKPEVNSQFFKTLKQAVPEIQEKRGTSADGARRRELIFPSLAMSRESMERYFKQPGMIAWSEGAAAVQDIPVPGQRKERMESVA
jgi:hypothetical protein